MKETTFSRRLSYLMKERKISGQKIGDAIGKTQKTISRYANGEVDPDNETKNKIFNAIACISGIEDDGKTIEIVEEEEFLADLYNSEEEWDTAAAELGRQHEEYRTGNIPRLREIFKTLSAGAKMYYLKNIRKFHVISDWEYEVLDIYKGMDERGQKKFMDILERYDLRLDRIQNCDKLAIYIEMIKESENRPVIIKADKAEAVKGNKEIDEEWDSAMLSLEYDCNYLYYFPASPDFIKYSPEDWYFLLRLQIFEQYEDNLVYINDYPEDFISGDDNTAVGQNLMNLVVAINNNQF